MNSTSRIFGHFWIFPWTFLGWLLAMFGGTQPWRSFGYPALEYIARPTGRLTHWFFDHFPDVVAFTWGSIVIWRSRQEAIARTSVRVHELRHVTQSMWFGPLWPLAYGCASFIAGITTGRWYRDNWFERDARRHAGQSVD